ALQTRANSGGVAPASPQVAYRALLERCIGRSPKKVGRIFGPRRGLRLPAWPRLGDLIGSPRAPLRAAPMETAQHVVRLWHARAGTQTSASSLCWRVRGAFHTPESSWIRCSLAAPDRNRRAAPRASTGV